MQSYFNTDGNLGQLGGRPWDMGASGEQRLCRRVPGRRRDFLARKLAQDATVGADEKRLGDPRRAEQMRHGPVGQARCRRPKTAGAAPSPRRGTRAGSPRGSAAPPRAGRGALAFSWDDPTKKRSEHSPRRLDLPPPAWYGGFPFRRADCEAGAPPQVSLSGPSPSADRLQDGTADGCDGPGTELLRAGRQPSRFLRDPRSSGNWQFRE